MLVYGDGLQCSDIVVSIARLTDQASHFRCHGTCGFESCYPGAEASISTTILPVVTCSPSVTSMAEIVPEIGAE